MRGEIIVDLNNLKANVKAYRERIDEKVKLIGVVKADGYGHGAEKIAETVDEFSAFAVATAEEALTLRRSTLKPILLLGVADYNESATLIASDVTLCAYENSQLKDIAKLSKVIGKTARVHIAVDTGMNRIGLKTVAEAEKTALCASHLGGVEVTGVFSHLYDCTDDAASAEQLRKFKEISRVFPKDVTRHLAASGRATDKDYAFSAVRLGLGIYGYGADFVSPCMSVTGRVVRVVKLSSGESVGYGGKFVAKSPVYVATLSLGYADGVPRSYTGGSVIIGGKKREIVGAVCMDFCFAVVERAVKVGDEAVFIGRSGESEITAEEVAEKTGTISYEILTGFKRLKRRYIL